MKILVLAAMNKEIELLLSNLSTYELIEDCNSRVYKSNFDSHEILIGQSGIGKVNAAFTSTYLIGKYSPDYVINSGVAGGISGNVHPGSVLLADKVVYHDVWCGPGTIFGQADGCPLFFEADGRMLKLVEEIAREMKFDIFKGLLCSGDQFISDIEEVRQIKEKFPEGIGCDMESAAIAQVAFKQQVPFIAIRVISDNPSNGENIQEYKDFWNDAPSRTFNVVFKLIQKL